MIAEPSEITERPAQDQPRRVGGVVVIAGPDGTGKSTLAEGISATTLAGRPVRRFAYRFGALPVRRGARMPTTTPHANRPYPPWLATLKLGYVFLDYLAGWLLVVRPFVRRGGWVILERGWWDLAVDPRRYRLGAAPRLTRLLGRLLPSPDVTLILDAAPAAILDRKTELPAQELERQSNGWRNVARTVPGAVLIDASGTADAVLARAAELILEAGDTPDAASEQGSWLRLPPGPKARWTLPTGKRRAAMAGLRIFQPMTVRAQLAWETTRALAAAGLLRLVSTAEAPDALRGLEPFIPPSGSVAIAHGSGPDRAVALIIDADGHWSRVAKIARDPIGHERLVREVAALEWVRPLIRPPLAVPRVLAVEDGVVVFQAADWRRRIRPWMLPPDLASAIGRFHRQGRPVDGDPMTGPAHGDFAPWNVLQTADGWVVVDWEEAERFVGPFTDVFHYLVQAHALLGRPTRDEIMLGLEGEGAVGRSLRAYAEAAEVSMSLMPDAFREYLISSPAHLNPAKRHWRRAIDARLRLLAAVDGGTMSPGR